MNKQGIEIAKKELKNPKYVFWGSVADVLEENKKYPKKDIDDVVGEVFDPAMTRGLKTFLYDQMKLRKERKMKEVV